MLQSYLISALTVRHRGSDLPAFAAEYPEAWLVWEPGPWLPAGKGKTGMVAVVGSARPTTPMGEVLAIHLKVDASNPQVTVGRDDTASIPINDATLSRIHLTVVRGQEGWSVDDAGSVNGNWLNGTRLKAGEPQPLSSGAQLQAGKVFLTFYQAHGMLDRIKARAR